MDSSDIRDNLALARTRLANERTFLAYVRTALSLIAAGVVLFQFFSSHPTYLLVAWLLVVSGGLLFLLGVFRFFRTNNALNASASSAGDRPGS